jgi:hypothetical protein
VVVPVLRSSSASPRVSKTSIVLACTPKARLSGDGASCFSSTTTERPASASSPATMQPAGPAPTTSTSTVSITPPLSQRLVT